MMLEAILEVKHEKYERLWTTGLVCGPSGAPGWLTTSNDNGMPLPFARGFRSLPQPSLLFEPFRCPREQLESRRRAVRLMQIPARLERIPQSAPGRFRRAVRADLLRSE